MVEHRPRPEGLTSWAIATARRHLAGALPSRWAHLQGVVVRALEVQPLLHDDGELLVVSAALHEIGWSPELRVSGLPGLDGARYLRELGLPHRVVNLVANYTFSRCEANLRGLGRDMAQFPDDGGPARDALWYCDLTVGPGGEPMTFEERMADMRARYANDEIASRFCVDAEPELAAACRRTEARLSVRGDVPCPAL